MMELYLYAICQAYYANVSIAKVGKNGDFEPSTPD
jgi:SAM-dependent MidA family methyltransferase